MKQLRRLYGLDLGTGEMQSFAGLDSENDSITQELLMRSNSWNDERLSTKTVDSSAVIKTFSSELEGEGVVEAITTR